MKIGNLDISSFKVGGADCSIYLGDTKLYPSEEPTPSFNGKWLATYIGGTTSSAECDASSAITQAEINTTDLVSVEIGDCVTNIGNYAFYNCSTLTSVAISNSVTSIGESAFEMCINLTSVIIGNSVETIDEYTFFGCTSLTSITIPNSVTSIGDAVFSSCQGLTSVTVLATTPPTLGGHDVFYDTNNCPIYVPCESVEAYKTASGWSDYADRIACKLKFTAKYSGGEIYEKGCDSSSLITTSVTNPTGYQYTAMTEAIIGDCVSTVAMNAFSGFTSLSSVTISDNVTSLANQVFKDCINLTEVKLPSGLGKILAKTFENCTSLKNIDIPSGVTMISGFENCTSLENITLPNAVSEIYGEAFKGCTSLKDISIPSGVNRIGDYAFYECSGLTSITVNAITPPAMGRNVFANTNNCPILVPSASLEAFKNAWSQYASRIQTIA